MHLTDDQRTHEWEEASRRASLRSSGMQDAFRGSTIDEGEKLQLDRLLWLCLLIDSLNQNAEIVQAFSPQTHHSVVELFRPTMEESSPVAVVMALDGKHYRIRLSEEVAKLISLRSSVIVDREALDPILKAISLL